MDICHVLAGGRGNRPGSNLSAEVAPRQGSSEHGIVSLCLCQSSEWWWEWLIAKGVCNLSSTALSRGSEALHSRITQMENSRLDLDHEYILPWLCQGSRHRKPPTSQQGSLYFIPSFWFPLVVSWTPDEEQLNPATMMCRTHHSAFRGTEGGLTKN